MTETNFDVSAFAYAHRGLWGGAIPENSLAAFSAAAARGFGCELDVRGTRDGRLVVFHDATLERMCGRPERVDQLPFCDLRLIRLPDGSPIPTLEEALEAMAGLPTLVEVKIDPVPDGMPRNRSFLPAVVGALKFSTAPAGVMSFDVPAMWHMASRAVTGELVDRPLGQLIEPLEQMSAADIAAKAESAGETGCTYLCPHHTSLAAVATALPLVTWTVRTEAELGLARKHGAAPIFEGIDPAEVS